MVTALFADIKGSTELMADLDPEEARAIIDPALRIMVRPVRSYEGYVVHSTGDGIYAVFGAPIAHEDHPQRGVYAALEMQKKLREHADRLANWVSRRSKCGSESIAAKLSCARSKRGKARVYLDRALGQSGGSAADVGARRFDCRSGGRVGWSRVISNCGRWGRRQSKASRSDRRL